MTPGVTVCYSHQVTLFTIYLHYMLIIDLTNLIAQLAGAVEYTEYISAVG